MSISALDRWVEAVRLSGALVYAKRLAANDTRATGAHQAGPYIPKNFLFRALPEIYRSDLQNPDIWFSLRIESHGDAAQVRAIWYNSRLFGKTRDEARITNFGGVQSPLLDPANTAALTLFAFTRRDAGPACRVWICTTLEEEAHVESYVGPVEPGAGIVWESSTGKVVPQMPGHVPRTCRLSPDQIPVEWLQDFPSGAEIVRKTLDLLPVGFTPPDERLLRRRTCEYQVFLSVEEAVVLPTLREGFTTMDAFVARAQSVVQRRKSRSGRSLELHMKEILIEEGLVEGRDFQHNVESDPRRRPDFLFPSQAAYRSPTFPSQRLAMLATKTTCRDRWRQVCNEADRIPTKHLLTLQEGVTQQQHAEMVASGVKLVVPKSLRQRYPEEIRSDLLTISDFLDLLERRRQSSR